MTAPRFRREATDGIEALGRRFALNEAIQQRLRLFLELLVNDPQAPTSIRTPQSVLEDHLADSLVALDLEAVHKSRRALDLGAGAGLPGLPLAIALPDTTFTLLDGAARKIRFLEQAVEVCSVSNAEVVHARAETFTAGLKAFDLVTARAVAGLPFVLEYGAPLLRIGGALVVWRGRREPAAEAAAGRAALELGLSQLVVQPVRPYARAEHRHLHVAFKLQDTPGRFPRRAGMALKRPLGTRMRQAASDRRQR
jgi:16S rRNA (guanine527-N7)-methyltransferase